MSRKEIKSVVIIGSGNVAEALARALGRSGRNPVQIFARNAERGAAVAAIGGSVWSEGAEQPVEADLYLVAVSDRAVGEVTARLKFPEDAIVAHTAGSVTLESLPASCHHRAVFYPMQTFTRGREVDFAQIPIFIEAEREDDCAALETFARSLSTQVLRANAEHRRRIHLAAVFACNFSNHMYALGEQVARQAGFDFEILKPLIAETAAKAVTAHSPAEVQTGPAVRNDYVTKGLHTELLATEPLLKTIYSTISQSIWETSKKI